MRRRICRSVYWWGAAVIEGAAAQAQNPQSADIQQPVLQADAALGRPVVVGHIMVAVDIEHRRVAHGDKEGEIFGP